MCMYIHIHPKTIGQKLGKHLWAVSSPNSNNFPSLFLLTVFPSTMTDPQISDSHPDPSDPLLGSDSDQPGTESPESKQTPNAGFPPGVAIAAEPISMLRPGEDSVEPAPKLGVRRRSSVEMSKRPSWLPDDWQIDLKVRVSGVTAGLIDRYFVEPSGNLRFRSKNEVDHFLETGSKLKRKATSEGDDGPSNSPMSSPKTSKKGKKIKDVTNDDGAETGSSKKRKKTKKVTNGDGAETGSSKKGKKAKNVPNGDGAETGK